MKRTSKILGLSLASVAISLLMSGCGTFCGAEEPMVKCVGANACGAHQIATPDKNSKNSGWVHMTEHDCHAAGGHVVN